jgi:hypothetical protein
VIEIWCKINDIRASNVTNKDNNLKVGRSVGLVGPKRKISWNWANCHCSSSDRPSSNLSEWNCMMNCLMKVVAKGTSSKHLKSRIVLAQVCKNQLIYAKYHYQLEKWISSVDPICLSLAWVMYDVSPPQVESALEILIRFVMTIFVNAQTSSLYKTMLIHYQWIMNMYMHGFHPQTTN